MRSFSLVAMVVAAALLPARAATDALADVRVALGGEAALAQVVSIHATGKIAMNDRARDGNIDVYFQAPDRFARITRLARTVPSSEYQGRVSDRREQAARDLTYGSLEMPDLTTDYTVTTTRIGFRGEVLLAPGRGGSAYDSMLGGGERQYARFAIPLLAHLTGSYRAHVTSNADSVQFAGEDGITWVLALDPATRLPATLTWAQTAPAGSAMAGTPSVMTFGDYRKVGALTWPHHIVTRLPGGFVEDVQIKKYVINGKIGEKIFR